MFFLNSVLLGTGLAMDAFTVSIVNALLEPDMSRLRRSAVSGVYAAFQFAMPLLGWLLVRTVAKAFYSFQKFIPWIALLLLLYIGGEMIINSLSKKESEKSKNDSGGLLTAGVLLMQGIATSIDALSAGFTIFEYSIKKAAAASFIIAAVTFAICLFGLAIGKRAADSVSAKAEIFGGTILIFIGLEIFIRGIFF